MNRSACFSALRFELDWRQGIGEVVPWKVRELLAVDIEEAADQGDVERLEVLWREIPMLVGEAIALMAAGVDLPV
jgi:hypothetical protein